MTAPKPLILRALASPEAGKAVLDELALRPREAFEALLNFQGPYPEGVHPIDVHEDLLCGLLTGLLRRCPELLIGPDPAKIPSRPFILISAAIAADDPRFADTILSGLRQRSIDLKLAALDGIVRRPFLRTPEVKARLQELMGMKSIARDRYVLGRFQQALDSFEGSV